MHPVRRVPRRVEQRAPGALLVALVVVGRDEALVAPPDVHRRPVDASRGGLGGQRRDVLEDGGADPAAGEHDRRRAVRGLRGRQPGDQRLGDGLRQVLGVGLDDESGGERSRLGALGGGPLFGAPAPWPFSSAGSNQTCSRTGEWSISPATPVAASSASR